MGGPKMAPIPFTEIRAEGADHLARAEIVIRMGNAK